MMSNYFFPLHKEWDWEALYYQLTMPGLEEELAFRGIMLGLLAKILHQDIRLFGIGFGSASMWATAILFGLAHGFTLSSNFELAFHTEAFFSTLSLGLIYAWLTVKSGSILLPLISHNLYNATLYLFVVTPGSP